MSLCAGCRFNGMEVDNQVFCDLFQTVLEDMPFSCSAAPAPTEKIHQRRCSTADESGLPENGI